MKKVTRSFAGHGGRSDSAQMVPEEADWKRALADRGGKAVTGVRQKPDVSVPAALVSKPLCSSCGGVLCPGNATGICVVCAGERAEDYRVRKQAEKAADPVALARRLEAMRRFLAAPVVAMVE